MSRGLTAARLDSLSLTIFLDYAFAFQLFSAAICKLLPRRGHIFKLHALVGLNPSGHVSAFLGMLQIFADFAHFALNRLGPWQGNLAKPARLSAEYRLVSERLDCLGAEFVRIAFAPSQHSHDSLTDDLVHDLRLSCIVKRLAGFFISQL